MPSKKHCTQYKRKKQHCPAFIDNNFLHSQWDHEVSLFFLNKQSLLNSNGRFMKIGKKRGRPRIAGKPREPNGRISRAQKPRTAPPLLTIEMRAKHFGLTIEEAKIRFQVPILGAFVYLDINRIDQASVKSNMILHKGISKLETTIYVQKACQAAIMMNLRMHLMKKHTKSGFKEQVITMKT